jgi:hypothetical protein
LPFIDECFDAQMEDINWTSSNYDDSGWDSAHEIGPVGTPPWTGMMQNTSSLQTNDMVYPIGFSAIEMTRSRPGYHFRLGPPTDQLMIFVTELSVSVDTVVKLWFVPSSSIPRLFLDGREVHGVDLTLSKGSHLLTWCHLTYGVNTPEVFFETGESLTFSAASMFQGMDVSWAYYCMPTKTLRYPWEESAGEVMESIPGLPELLTMPAMKDVLIQYPQAFKPVTIMENSTLHDAMTRQYFKMPGGFTDLRLECGALRDQIDGDYQKPLLNEQNLLHDNADFCTILPQDSVDVHFIVDFNKLLIGYVGFEIDAPADTIIDIHCVEMIDGGGLSWMTTSNSLRYVCREGRQHFLSHMRRGFRYACVIVKNFNRPIQFHRLYCKHASFPVQTLGKFECSDMLLNQIYKISVDTAALCMLDTYVDCTGHEQNMWVGDARITALINLLTFGAYRLNQHHIRLIGQSLSSEWVKTYWPNDERYTSGRYLPIAAYPNYPEGGLPMWTYMWMMQCWEHYLYGDSKTDLKENFGYMVETLRHCQLLTNERNLFDMPGAWNLIEWANNDLSPYGEVTANNVLLVQCLRLTAKMARMLCLSVQAAEYEKEAQSRMDAINRYCWDETRQGYVDTVRDRAAYERSLPFCKSKELTILPFEKYKTISRISEQTNTLALLCDCVPADRLESVKKIVQRAGRGDYVCGAPSARSYGPPSESEAPDGIVAIGSPFFLFFSIEALFKMGDVETAMKVIRNAWTVMVESGTKGCWETFKSSERHWTRSISHAWSASPAIYLPTEILGIKPIEPGYRKFIIAPNPLNLTWARGSVVTPYGPIQISWTKNADGTLKIDYSAPSICEKI